eukprot:CAMPEP_0174835252 /NCGR_PEP_ID=MMETSP1114-20130205/5310_1 /TAXON_ID=312471 /ORGANISM="Neobodo designis, Strain CCAP 1951/1" /LENGTH=611 /DNA_ID=CAMNT_0016069197 /DNA_START=48 /DNA_END=1883 /DNA_ORIENTATION=+
MALTLQLPAFDDLPQSIAEASFVPLAAPVRRSIAAFGGAYVAHAFPADLPDPSGQSSSSGKPSGSPSGRSEQRRDMGDRKKNVKLDEADLEVDWYALLKLPDAEGSTDDQIKSAYRRRCLDTHPDKQPDGSDVEFKRVQRAFEILGNPEARRSYDSSRPFDDSIPGEGPFKDDSDFYSTFAPVFARNSKWSAEPNMPQIGDNDTPLDDVRRMYDQWLAFRTWRDFSNEVELQEIDEGMMREERRYYQRENQRLLDKMNKEELKRIRTLVDRAMKNDPRLRRYREAEEAARKKVLEEKAAAKAAAEDAERKAREEKEAAELAAKEAEKQKAIDAKMTLKTSVKQVADFLKDKALLDDLMTNKLLACKVRKPNVQWVLQNCNVDEATAIRDAVTSASAAVVASAPPADSCEEADAAQHVPAVVTFNQHVKAIEARIGRNRYGEGIKKSAGAASPAGKKHVDPAAAAAPKPAVAKASWTDEDIIQLQKLAIKYPGGAVDRWRHIAQALDNRFTEEQVLEQVKNIERGIKTGQKPPSAVSMQTGIPDAPVAPAAPAADDWTPNQQKQLEAGLRDMKDYKEKDKFAKIAAKVEGKSAKQCFERFKYLCAMRKKAGQ